MYLSWRVPPAGKIPLLTLVSTYLAPSSCDRSRPPRSQVACKLLPFVPHCSLVPSPPKSQSSLGFPEPNVHLIRRITNPFPSVQNITNMIYPAKCHEKCSLCVRHPLPSPVISKKKFATSKRKIIR